MEPIYGNISYPSTSSETGGDENPRPAPRTRRRTSSTDSSDSGTSTASSTLTPHSLATYRSQQKVGRSPVAVTHRTVTRETAARRMVRTPSTASTTSRASTRAPSSSSSSGSERGKQRPARNPHSGQKKAAPRKTSTKDKIQVITPTEISGRDLVVHIYCKPLVAKIFTLIVYCWLCMPKFRIR